MFGILAVNGWHNLFHLATGLLGLTPPATPRAHLRAGIGLLYLVVAIWGFIVGGGDVDPRHPPGQHRGQLPAPDPRPHRLAAGAAIARRRRPLAAPSSGRPLLDRRLSAAGAQPRRRPAAAAHPDDQQGARRRRVPAAAAADRADPVARVAQRLELALRELVGPARELGGGLLGDRGQGALDASRGLSGGSIGRSASASSASRSRCSGSVIVLLRRPSLAHLLFELLDRAMDQDLGRAVGAPERTGDLAVRHPEREAHDQRLAAVVRQPVQPVA